MQMRADLPWGVAYLNGTAGWPDPPGIFVHPAPAYDMLALLGILVVLSGLTRLLVECVRTNPPVLFGLTEAQWTSIVLSGARPLM